MAQAHWHALAVVLAPRLSPVSDYKTAAQRKTSLVSCPRIHGAQHLPRLLALAERLEMQTITRALLPIRNAQTSWSARRLSSDVHAKRRRRVNQRPRLSPTHIARPERRGPDATGVVTTFNESWRAHAAAANRPRLAPSRTPLKARSP